MRPTSSQEILQRIRGGELIAPDTGALQPAPKPLDETLQETEVESLARRHRYLEVTNVFIQAFTLLQQSAVSLDEFYDWASRRIESENTEHFRLLRSRLYQAGLLDDEDADPKTVRLVVLNHQRALQQALPAPVASTVPQPEEEEEEGVGEEEDFSEEGDSEEQEESTTAAPRVSPRRRRTTR